MRRVDTTWVEGGEPRGSPERLAYAAARRIIRAAHLPAEAPRLAGPPAASYDALARALARRDWSEVGLELAERDREDLWAAVRAAVLAAHPGADA